MSQQKSRKNNKEEVIIQAIERVLDRYRPKPTRAHIDWSRVNGMEALAMLKDELEKEEGAA